MAPEFTPKPRPPGRGLSAKLLGLTLGFIMLAEVLVFLPSIGRTLQVYGDQQVIELERGVLALELLGNGEESWGEENQRRENQEAPAEGITRAQAQALQAQLLTDARWLAFAARLPDQRSLLAGLPQDALHVDLRRRNSLAHMGQALRLLVAVGPPRVLLFSSLTRDGQADVDIWMLDTALQLRGV